MRSAGATLRLFAQWLRPTTNKGKTNPSGLAFFCLLPRVCAGSCGFLRTTERAISASNRHGLLSVCTFSLRPTPPSAGRSGDGPQVMSTKNLSAAEYLIRNCTVAFKCRTRWQDLPDDGIESVRFCGECQKEVHLCTSEKGLREALLDNLCVAIEVRSQKSEMILGQLVLNRGA